MNTTNTNITLHGNPLKVAGNALTVGQPLPSFTLTANDLSDLKSDSFKGTVLVISVVPSLDTPTCAKQTSRFNQEASKLGSAITILTVSRDLPFAQKRWCGLEGADRVVTASDYKYRTFGESFGALAADVELLARAVFVVDKGGIIRHVEYVQELSAEPQYDAALAMAKDLAAQ